MLTWKNPLGGRDSLRAAADRFACCVAAVRQYVDEIRFHRRTDFTVRDIKDDPEIGEIYMEAWFWNERIGRIKDLYPLPKLIAGVELDPYQLRVLTMSNHWGGVLDLGCGLGKTATALAWVYQRQPRRFLVVAPRNAFGTWEKQREWVEEALPGIDYSVASVDGLHKLDGLPFMRDSVVVFDEAHLVSNYEADRTKRAAALRRQFGYGLALTGTLLHGGIDKSLAALNLAMPGAARMSNKWALARALGCYHTERQQHGNTTREVGVITEPTGEALDQFHRFLAPWVISMTKKTEAVQECISIPDQDVVTIPVCEPWPSAVASLVASARTLQEETGELPPMMAALNHCLRAGADAKLVWLCELLSEPEAEPVVVFAWSLETLDLVEGALTEFFGEGFVVRVDGSVTDEARVEAVRRFDEDEAARVFLGQMDAACTSIDLTKATVSVALDHTRRAANYDQMLARTCRRGQDRPCTHLDLVANAVQQRVVERLRCRANFDSKLAEYQELSLALKEAL